MKTTLSVLLGVLFTFSALAHDGPVIVASEANFSKLQTRFARASAPALSVEQLKGRYAGACYGAYRPMFPIPALLFVESTGKRRKLTKLGLAFQADVRVNYFTNFNAAKWERINTFVTKYVSDSFLSDAFVANDMLTSEYADKGSYDLRADGAIFVARVFSFASSSTKFYCYFYKTKLRAPSYYEVK